MGNSLHDQLLKAGLVSEKQVKQAKKQQRKKSNQERKGKTGQVDQRQAQRSQRQQAERDRELNRQRQARLQKRQQEAQIRQLIESNRLSTEEGEISYSFVSDNKVTRIYVTEAQRNKLTKGGLAIVTLDRRHVLVPATIADKIQRTDASRVVVRHDGQSDEPVDDDYADYKIPDDLMW